ncbi:MAG: PEP-CTERM sorting domain-containing protein [bacterium]|nr:PEP-CTERM sorting domain-containing protein [bacterium]
MKKVMFSFLVGSILFLCMSNLVFAVPCTIGSVSGSVGCQDGTANNDKLSPLQVNLENFFGNADWIFLQKQDIGGSLETDINVNWTVTPPTPSPTGEWSFSPGLWSNYEDAMIVVKAGPQFSGYLLDNTLKPTSGDWDTGDKDLSHLTLYARGQGPPIQGPPIPEPTTILLTGLGILLLGGITRWKSKK